MEAEKGYTYLGYDLKRVEEVTNIEGSVKGYPNDEVSQASLHFSHTHT